LSPREDATSRGLPGWDARPVALAYDAGLTGLEVSSLLGCFEALIALTLRTASDNIDSFIERFGLDTEMVDRAIGRSLTAVSLNHEDSHDLNS
jgi:hypothetical protein